MPEVARRHTEWLASEGYRVTAVHSWMERSSGEVKGVVLKHLPWPKRFLMSRLNPWNYSSQLHAYSKRVSAVIEFVGPDLVYSEGLLLSDYLRRPNDRRVPTIFHPHGLEMFQNMGSLLLNARAWPLRAVARMHGMTADRTITQGGRLTEILQTAVGVPKERLAYLPNCAPNQFELASHSRNGHRCRFLFVGRAEPRKGLHLLLSTFSAVDGATLAVVGSSADSSLIASNVVLHGPVHDRDALRDLFDAADYLVVPSSAEGMATVILEAFSRGLPVIATDVGASCDLVRNGSSGWLITPGDASALLKAIVLARDLPQASYSLMSDEALRIATNDFSPARVKRMLVELVESVLRQNSRATSHVMLTDA